jgi:hypothetical protein
MALPIEEVLAQWREAERTRDTLPANHPRRKVIDARIVELRGMYRDLTSAAKESDDLLEIAHDQAESAQATLDRIAAKLRSGILPAGDRADGLDTVEPGS